MKRLVITEKPSVAETIARAIGVRNKVPGYFQGKAEDGNYYSITWCLGHLLEIYVPEADGPWQMEKLPILPEKISLRPIRSKDDPQPYVDSDGRTVIPENDYDKRIRVIRELADWCNEIIAATDAGREGQGIFENLYSYLGCTKPVKRLWISSLEEQDVLEGFKNLYDNSSPEFHNLGVASRVRSEADWLVGVNATRALTLATRYKDIRGKNVVLSLGRVQTPTLCMICRRWDEHVNFKSEAYWILNGEAAKDGVTFRWRNEKRYSLREEAVRDQRKIMDGGVMLVSDVDVETKNAQPPLLHDIASLQKMANFRYGMTLDETLNVAQSLYEKRLISYPRTGSRYIPESVFLTIPTLLQKFTTHPDYGEFAKELIAKGHYVRRSVNDTKITDHHAIITTRRHPRADELNEQEKLIYDLIVSRMIEAFSPANTYEITTVRMQSEDLDFIVRSRRDIVIGWRDITRKEGGDIMMEEDGDDDITSKQLPHMEAGDTVNVLSANVVEDKTKPRPLLTDATLCSMMENAGKQSDDKTVTATLKDIGIGTPATRHEILATLVARKYVERKERFLYPTTLGLTIYNALSKSELTSVEMTAQWEMALGDIANDGADEKVFEKNIRTYAARLTKEIINLKSVQEIRDHVEAQRLRCPKCGNYIFLGDKSAWCKSCGFTLWRQKAGKTLGDGSMRALLTRGYTGLLSGFRKKDGTTFNASVRLLGNGQTELVFEKKQKPS